MKLYRNHLRKIAAGTTIDYLRDQGESRSLPILVRRLAAWDSNNAVTVFIEIGIGNQINDAVLARNVAPPAANFVVELNKDFIVAPDESIYAAFNLATANDVLHLVIIGEFIE